MQWALTCDIVVKGKTVVRPSINACLRCFLWWTAYISPLLTWPAFADKWNKDPIYKAKIINGEKALVDGSAPTYRRSSCQMHDGSFTHVGRSWIILNKKEMETESGKAYLKKEQYSGVQMTAPKESGDGDEAVWAFPDPQAPFRRLTDFRQRGEDSVTLVQGASQDIWSGKSEEVMSVLKGEREKEMQLKLILNRTQPMVSLESWKQRVKGQQDEVGGEVATSAKKETPSAKRIQKGTPRKSVCSGAPSVCSTAASLFAPVEAEDERVAASQASVYGDGEELDNPFLPGGPEDDVNAEDSASQVGKLSELDTAGHLVCGDGFDCKCLRLIQTIALLCLLVCTGFTQSLSHVYWFVAVIGICNRSRFL